MRIRHASILNFFGLLVAPILGIVTTPLYLSLLGTRGFGLLILMLAFLTWLSLFDFGISKSITRFLALNSSVENRVGLKTILSLAGISFFSGLFFAIVFVSILHLIPLHWFGSVSNESQDLILASQWLLLAVPFSNIIQLQIGTLQGRQRFFLYNLLIAFNALAYWVSPLLFGYFVSADPPSMFAIACVSKVIISILGLVLVRLVSDVMLFEPHNHCTKVLKFGGWVNIAGLVGTLFGTVDRIIIGSVIGTSGVGVYAVASQFGSGLNTIGNSIAGAIYPKFSNESETHRKNSSILLFRSVFAISLPISIVAIFFSYEILEIWISQDFAQTANIVTSIMIFSFWLNGLCLVPFMALLASGRSKAVAISYLCQAVPYLVAFAVSSFHHGLLGAAVVFAARTFVDGIILSTLFGVVRSFLLYALLGTGSLAAVKLLSFVEFNIH